MKSNRQIGLDGRTFISDCLSDGIFFVYSIILSGLLGALGDIMKLLGKSSQGMDLLTNGLVLCDLVCSLGMILVAYYVYFMHCGENMPRLGVKPLLYLEYGRLAYYGVLIYEVLYRFTYEIKNGEGYPAAMPVFYFIYIAWLVTCVFAAMFILTILHQNVIRRSYAQSFKWLSLIGLGINILLPLVYFVTRIWVRGWGDGFYSAGLCDFVRFALAPAFYIAIWFLLMNAIDQVDRVFGEVDNAIRDKRYRIEFEDTDGDASSQKSASRKKSKAVAAAAVKKAAAKAGKYHKKVKPKKKHRIVEAEETAVKVTPKPAEEPVDADSEPSDSVAEEAADEAPIVDPQETEVDINAFLSNASEASVDDSDVIPVEVEGEPSEAETEE